MTRTSEEESSKWDQLSKNLDVMFSQISEMHDVQKKMKAQMDLTAAAMDDYSTEQHLIAQQVHANGEAIARVTLRQMEDATNHTAGPKYDEEPRFDEDDLDSLLLDEHTSFQNVFATQKNKSKAEPSRRPRLEIKPEPKEAVPKQDKQASPKHTIPKMNFPDFDGSDPKVWLDNCYSYFELYQIPEGMWITAARIHLKDNAARWYQAFKQKHTFRSWTHFCHEIEKEFGADDFRSSMTELLQLKQTGSVEEYTTQFQNLQYGVTMHNANYDDMFFTQHYIMGLREDIRGMVEAQMPTTVLTASTLAKVQQKVLERSKTKAFKPPYQPRAYNQQKTDARPQQHSSNLWQDRQLRDYRRNNGLCFYCGDKFVPGHIEVCSKRQKPKINALAVNDLDRELTDEVLNDLATEDALHEDFCQLSLNALSSTDKYDCIKLRTKVKNKTMLMLVDSGSTHSFISSNFVQLAQLPTIPIPPRKVKLANGEWITTNRMVSQLPCYCQGQTFTTDMIVLDMNPYDAILGFDWLRRHSPMVCDWEHKSLQFEEQGSTIQLKGLTAPPLHISAISANKVYKATKSNELWAFVLLDYTPIPNPTQTPQHTTTKEDIQHLLTVYKDVFTDPQLLPPKRSYDHAIPLLPNSIPINARPYHYSPTHKTEIENQVQQLLQAGLITHSHSPFASPILLVKKKMAPGVFV